MSHEREYTLGDIAQMNISKLATRYPDGFSREASQNRRCEMKIVKKSHEWKGSWLLI